MLKLACLALFPLFAFPQQLTTFKDPNATPEARAADLVANMTLEEKVSQMQNTAVEIKRLGIPAYDWWNEGLHGVARAGLATVFPQAIGVAATFDTDLMHRIATTISTEGRAKYNDAVQRGNHGRYFGLTFWSPNINIFRDPRWGRGQETYGEDPYLTSRLAEAFIRGIQGDDVKYFKAIATAKHFAVHSGPETTRHIFNVTPSEADLNGTYLPAFKASVVEAYSVMCAYNAVDGAPACGSTMLLQDKLHKAWGFHGYVVSDCGAIGDFVSGHKYSPDMAAASAAAVKAGTQLDCGTEYKNLVEAVHRKLIAEADIDHAVEKLFVARIRLGMFDPPERVPFSKLSMTDVSTADNQALSLQTARESMVLLKNEGSALPLKSKPGNVAVIGPSANDPDALLGNYNGIPPHIITPLEGLERAWGEPAVHFALGVTYTAQSNALIPPNALTPAKSGKGVSQGLTVEYFDNDDLKGQPKLARTERQGYLRWDMQDAAIVAAAPREHFSVRWSGRLTVGQSGAYQLGFTRLECADCTGKDSASFYLDGKLIVSDDHKVQWQPSTKMASVELTAGKQYKIVVEYRQSGAAAGLEIVWHPGAEILLKDALDRVAKADLAVVCLGLNSKLEGEESPVKEPGFEGGDRTTLDLPAGQQELLSKVLALNKPVILVLLNGSAVTIPTAGQAPRAILEAWYPGQEGGTAIAETLIGENNPAGRLPVTFYQSTGDLPPFDDYSMKNRTYRYFTGKPLYPFGYGLSYSSFQYSDQTVSRESGGLVVTAKVTNTSSIAGDEVPQLYLTYPGATNGPKLELGGFTRLHLAAGASQTVRFTLKAAQLRDGRALISIGGGQPGSEWTAGHFVQQELAK
jgi:beta-glucosidase